MSSLRWKGRQEHQRNRSLTSGCCPTAPTGHKPFWKYSWTLNLTMERGPRSLSSMLTNSSNSQNCFLSTLLVFSNLQWDQWDHKCEEGRCHFNAPVPQPHQLLQGERLSISVHSEVLPTGRVLFSDDGIFCCVSWNRQKICYNRKKSAKLLIKDDRKHRFLISTYA